MSLIPDQPYVVGLDARRNRGTLVKTISKISRRLSWRGQKPKFVRIRSEKLFSKPLGLPSGSGLLSFDKLVLNRVRVLRFRIFFFGLHSDSAFFKLRTVQRLCRLLLILVKGGFRISVSFLGKLLQDEGT